MYARHNLLRRSWAYKLLSTACLKHFKKRLNYADFKLTKRLLSRPVSTFRMRFHFRQNK